MAKQKLKTELLELVEGHLIGLGRSLSVDEDLFDAGLESMGIMQLIIQIEEKLGLVLGEADVTRENFSSVAALAELLSRMGSSRE